MKKAIIFLAILIVVSIFVLYIANRNDDEVPDKYVGFVKQFDTGFKPKLNDVIESSGMTLVSDIGYNVKDLDTTGDGKVDRFYFCILFTVSIEGRTFLIKSDQIDAELEKAAQKAADLVFDGLKNMIKKRDKSA